MGRDVGVNFVVSAAQKGTKAVFAGTKKLIEAQGKALEGLGKTGGSVFGGLGKGLIAWDAGLNIARKGLEIWQLTMGRAFEASLRFRRENDEQTASLDDLKESVDRLQARAGDALLPVIVALVETVDPLVDQLTMWLAENNKLVASKIVEFALKLGDVIGNVVAPAVALIIKAFIGWKLILKGVGLAIGTIVAIAIDGFSSIVKAAGKLAGALKMEELSQKIAAFGTEIDLLNTNVIDFAADMEKGIEDDLEALKTIDATAKKFGDTFKEAVGVFAVNAAKQLEKATIGGNVSLEKRQELLKEQARLEKELESKRKEREREELRRAKEAEAGREAQIAGLAQIQGAIESGTAAIAEGSGTAKDFIKSTIRAIAAEAAAWAMRSIFANLAIPFPANIALAGLTSGIVQGSVGKLAGSFHEGGRIRRADLLRQPGDAPGEGLIRAREDELVLTPRQQQQAGMAGASGVAGGLTVNFNSAFPISQADARTVVQMIERPLLQLIGNGRTRTR